MKKLSVVAVALLLAVSSGYASWDYFPPKDAGSGEAKLGFSFGMPAEKVTSMGLSLDARYGIIEGLEAALFLPIPLSYSIDGNSSDGYAGLSLPAIGVRYWLPMSLGFFLDFALPVDTRDGREPAMELALGAQYSMNFTEEFSFGSELGLIVPFATETEFLSIKTKTTEGMDLKIGVEFDYSLGMVTPFLGADMLFGITKQKTKVGEADAVEAPDTAPMSLGLFVGAAFDINEMFGADVSLGLGLGERDGGKDNTPITIGAHFSFKF